MRGARSQFKECELNLEDSAVQFKGRFKYLGLVFEEGGGLGAAREHALLAGRRVLYAALGSLMAIEHISYSYVVILHDALVISVVPYGCNLWSAVARNMAATTQHDAFYKDLIRKELGVSKLCPVPLFLRISWTTKRSSSNIRYSLESTSCLPNVEASDYVFHLLIVV